MSFVNNLLGGGGDSGGSAQAATDSHQNEAINYLGANISQNNAAISVHTQQIQNMSRGLETLNNKADFTQGVVNHQGQILDQHSQALTQHSQILDQHGQTLDAHETKLELLGQATINHGDRIESLETRADAQDTLNTQQQQFNDAVFQHEITQDQLLGKIADHQGAQDAAINSNTSIIEAHDGELLSLKHAVFPHDYSSIGLG